MKLANHLPATGCLALLLAVSIGQASSYYVPIKCGEIVLQYGNSSEDGDSFKYALANFGPNLPPKPYLKGLLYKAYPEEGCRAITPPPSSIGDRLWIALIKRSPSEKSCTFLDKVLNAQRSGYNAVIVYNNNPDEYDLVPMNTDDDTGEKMVRIASVFVSYEDGLDLCAQSYHYNQLPLTFAEFQPKPNTDELKPYKILIPMAFSFVGILMVAIIVMIVRWCQAVRRKHRSRISKRQLKKLPLVKYKKEDQYDCCAICLDDYEEGEKLRQLPCAHTYHQKCIDPWLLKNKKTCPVCKRRVIPKVPRRNNQPRDSSDSEDEVGREVENERTPLLSPPTAGDRLGAVGGSPQYGTSGGAEGGVNSVTAVANENDDMASESGQRSATNGGRRSRAHRDHRNLNSRNRRLEESSSSEEYTDDENDLRRSILVQVSMTPQSYVDVGHRLNSFPSRSGFSQSTDNFYSSVPPIEQTQQRATDRRSHEANDLVTRSHDLDVAAQSGDYSTVDMEAPFLDSVDADTPLIANNIII